MTDIVIFGMLFLVLWKLHEIGTLLAKIYFVLDPGGLIVKGDRG